MLILTNRDIQIFKLLNELWIAQSNVIKGIISPNIKQKSFNQRLLELKKEGFIIDVWKWEITKRDYMIYQLTNISKIIQRIKNETWIGIEQQKYNLSHLMLNHQLLLWKLALKIISKIRNKNKDVIINIDNLKWSKTIQGMITKEKNKVDSKIIYLDSLPIQDLMIEINNTLYMLELENTNSNSQFEEKIRKYQELYLKKDNENFHQLFRKKNIILIVWCWENKKERYEEILKWIYNWKYKIIYI